MLTKVGGGRLGGMIALLQALYMCLIFCDPSLTVGILKHSRFSDIIRLKICTYYVYNSCMHMWNYWWAEKTAHLMNQ